MQFHHHHHHVTSLSKVSLEEGRVAALSHTYAVKSPLVTMARPKFAHKNTPSGWPIPKPHYLPHPWTRPTYDAKWHPDPIRRFSTMHWTDRRTHVRTYTDRPKESLTTTGRCATRATRLNTACSGVYGSPHPPWIGRWYTTSTLCELSCHLSVYTAVGREYPEDGCPLS